MPDIPAFDEYVRSLGRLTAHIDPTAASPAAADIKEAATSLAALSEITEGTLTAWAADHPSWVNVLGLAVGLSQEKLKNTLKHHFDTTGWVTLARTRPADLVRMLDADFDLVRLVTVQRERPYDFGDVLVARAGTRQTASRAGASGRKVEDEIEAIAHDLGLPCQTRTRFMAVIDAPHPAIWLSQRASMPRSWSPRRASTRPDRNSPTQSGKSRKWPTYACPASSSWL